MQEDALCSYAQLASMHAPQYDDLATYWTDPSSTILAPGMPGQLAFPLTISSQSPTKTGHLLKGAVEDLEWPGGDVVVRLTSSPPAAVLSSQGTNGALQISLPLGDLAQLSLPAREVCHRYAYRHMAAALANLPASSRDQHHIHTKVRCVFCCSWTWLLVHVITCTLPGGYRHPRTDACAAHGACRGFGGGANGAATPGCRRYCVCHPKG